MALISIILMASRSDCFNMHFGLPKAITNAKVGQSHNGSKFMDLTGTATVTLDSETLAQLQRYQQQQGETLQVMIDPSEIPLKPNGELDINPQRIRELLLSKQPQMPMPSTSRI